MKKSFERMKVRLEQNMNRTEKTEALTTELVRIEELIGGYKQACQTLQRKFSEGLQGFGKGMEGAAIERRLKKTPDFIMGQTLSEVGRALIKQAPNTCFGKVLAEMGTLCNSLAYNHIEYEISIEKLIIGRLQDIINTDLPAITASRKQLDKLVLDLDTARTKLDRAKEEELHGAVGPVARIERLIEELDDISRKVEQSRDNVAADMMLFLSRDAELASLLTKFFEHKLALFRDSASQVEAGLPKLEEIAALSLGIPVFSNSLSNHLEAFSIESGIAFPIQLCVTKLIELGLDEEGLFRLAAGSSKVRRLRAEIESGQATLASLDQYDHHVLTGVIKSYLRELPTPLFGEGVYQDWLEAGQLPVEDRFDAVWNLLQGLPRENFKNIQYLFQFLNEVTKYSDQNKMTASNLAIVITPNVIWETESVSDPLDVSQSNFLAQVVELIISQQSWFFQNEKTIPWSHQFQPLGHSLLLNAKEDSSITTAMSGVSSAAAIPVLSSPTPFTRDNKKTKGKKPPPLPPNLGASSSPTHSSLNSSGLNHSSGTSPGYGGKHGVGGEEHFPATTHNAGSSSMSSSSSLSGSSTKDGVVLVAEPSGGESPVSLRKNSPNLSRHGEGTPYGSRSKSVESQYLSRGLQHPTQPPPKPPSNGRNSTPAEAAVRDPSAANSALEVKPKAANRSSNLYPDLGDESLNVSRDSSAGRQDTSFQDESSAITNDRSSYPVPAPRTSKPALPSKPEGLSRNMSIRTSGDRPATAKDSTNL